MSNDLRRWMALCEAEVTPAETVLATFRTWLAESGKRLLFYADAVRPDEIFIRGMVAQPTGTGFGTEAMKHLMALCAAQHVAIELEASAEDAVTDEDGEPTEEQMRLEAWYLRLGFDYTDNVGKFGGPLLRWSPDDAGRLSEAQGTVGAALTVPDLIRRYGGRAVEFRNLPATAKQAILTRAAEHLDPDAKPRINPKMRFGYVELPTEALQQAVLAAVQREGAPFKTFDEYHRWYVNHGDTPSHTEVWPIELDLDDPDQIIEDGSHRFHSYVRSGVKMIPAIYRV